ncbi:MAG: NuoF family protein [Roseiflexaceae bacterium]|nr:NuoF family protein [Roseiflexaceae bacterium]
MERSELIELGEKTSAARKAIHIQCCTSSGCQSALSLEVKRQLEEAVTAANLGEQVEIRSVGCMGFCGQGPMVSVLPDGLLYEHVTPEQAPSIIAALQGGQATAELGDHNHPFFTGQHRIVLENIGTIDPERIEDYIAVGGYLTLEHVLHEMTPADVIDTITRSGLRGRGGAGYPTGLKWATVAKNVGEHKYVVCNGDEGDPGAFMDRSVLESDPHRVIEGMAIAAYAVGADQGFLYVRAEYPLAISRLQKAIQQARKYGLLGTQIFDTSFNFRIDIRIGAGAFVCGEETALIASIEGNRGQPRPRPPYPAEHGLWGFPTLINNVETLANIVPIVRDGPEQFAAIGTENSKGTKVFALTGKICNTGLLEVPMGTTIRAIVQNMGGGAPDGKAVKAVQTGGPSGGCIPAELFDTPVDYDSLNRVGSIMGSGGMVVMDETTSMVQIARFYMEFCMDESCGKCVPCRVGTVQMFRLLNKICDGKATQNDIVLLQELCEMVRSTSLCGLGQSAPNPVLSTLRYFRPEYEVLLQ